MIVLGTTLLWFGWLGFNGGSAFGANLRAAIACWNSNLCAMFAAATWSLLDFRLAKKWSMVGWCSGAISGLVAATPSSGFITPWGSIILGIVTGVTSNYATKRRFPTVHLGCVHDGSLTLPQSSISSALTIQWMSLPSTGSQACLGSWRMRSLAQPTSSDLTGSTLGSSVAAGSITGTNSSTSRSPTFAPPPAGHLPSPSSSPR